VILWVMWCTEAEDSLLLSLLWYLQCSAGKYKFTLLGAKPAQRSHSHSSAMLSLGGCTEHFLVTAPCWVTVSVDLLLQAWFMSS